MSAASETSLASHEEQWIVDAADPHRSQPELTPTGPCIRQWNESGALGVRASMEVAD